MIKQIITNHDQLLKFTEKRFNESSKLEGDSKRTYETETSRLFKLHSKNISVRELKKKHIEKNIANQKNEALLSAMEKDRHHRIYMSNELINASHSLDLNEKKIMAISASRIHKHFLQDEIIEITIKEYKELFKISGATAYSDLMRASETLMQKCIIWSNPKIPKESWVAFVEYDHGHSKIRLKLTSTLIQHMQPNHRGKFTQLKLEDFAKLKTFYAQRLYELLMQYADTGKKHIKINDLIFATDAPESYLKDFSIIRARIITPSIKQIAKLFKVIYKGTKRKGQRKNTSVLFSFKKQQVRRLPSTEFDFIDNPI